MAYETKIELRSDKTVVLDGKEAKSVEGYYLGNKVTPDKGYGPGLVHFFKTKSGVVGVWGKSRLNSLMTANHIGQMCLVTFTGMSDPAKGRRAAYMYQLKFDTKNTIDVSGMNIGDIGAGEPETDEEYIDKEYVEEEYGETALDTEEVAPDEVTPRRPTLPARATSIPNAARKAQVEGLLSSRKRA